MRRRTRPAPVFARSRWRAIGILIGLAVIAVIAVFLVSVLGAVVKLLF